MNTVATGKKFKPKKKKKRLMQNEVKRYCKKQLLKYQILDIPLLALLKYQRA